jgi:hypothetical protein
MHSCRKRIVRQYLSIRVDAVACALKSARPGRATASSETRRRGDRVIDQVIIFSCCDTVRWGVEREQPLGLSRTGFNPPRRVCRPPGAASPNLRALQGHSRHRT